MASPKPPKYEFEESDLFKIDRERIIAAGVSEQEFDSHQWAIQDQILPNPLEEPWSQLVPTENPGNRVAVSDATDAEPNALLILFRVQGGLIKLERVRLRNG